MTNNLYGFVYNQGFIEEEKEEDSDKLQRLVSFISSMLQNNTWRPPIKSLFTVPVGELSDKLISYNEMTGIEVLT